jgi:uncharacterized protein (UPF0332 family)
MVNLKWCCRTKEGIKLIEPSDNLALSYIKMAENAIGTMNREKDLNKVFAISACYYSMYYSLYSILMKLGIKCEIHTCTLEFMKKQLSNFYSPDDVNMIAKAFELRGIAQYYVDKVLDQREIEFIITMAPLFLNKSKQILSKINERNIKEIKDKISQFSL